MIDRLDILLVNPELLDIKKLRGPDNSYRIRSGDYRIVIEIRNLNKEIVVVTLGHRKEVYKLLQGLSVLFMMNINI